MSWLLIPGGTLPGLGKPCGISKRGFTPGLGGKPRGPGKPGGGSPPGNWKMNKKVGNKDFLASVKKESVEIVKENQHPLDCFM